MRLTVFLATFNRLDTLNRTIRSFEKLTMPMTIVIVDNGTDNPECLQLLERVSKRPVVSKVYSLPRVSSMQELTDNFNIAIRDRYQVKTRTHWSAVTDADVCFDGASTDTLEAYVRLASKTGFSVGPHLRVDGGIPAGYPLRSRVLATESRLLYRSTMEWLGRVPYSPWQIDTSFHLFRSCREFKRLQMNTVRVGFPFDAMHLDWYIDVRNPTLDNRIYALDDRGAVGSWGRNWLRGVWRTWFDEGREALYQKLLKAPKQTADLCNASFLLSWCLQYGFGTPADSGASRYHLLRAVPADSVWQQHQDDWMRMIYDNDFSSLGWDEADTGRR